MKEEWRNIPEYEGIYQVSNQGQVKSLDRYLIWRGKEKFYKGKILKSLKNKGGYLFVNLYINSKLKNHLIHRLVLTVFDRPPKKGEECNHKDGNKQNNFIGNLEWVTSKENVHHAIEILHIEYGSKGEKHGSSKLTEQQVKEIKILLKEGKLSQREIAKIYNVHFSIISRIKSGKRWKHVKI